MKLLSPIRFFASTLFRRSTVESEIDEELRAHIRHRGDDLERGGLSRREAERRACLEFGGYQKFKEECREAIGTHFIETLLQDVRYGLRALRKSPGFTTVAVLTLALGIGANTTIFSAISAILLRKPPVKDPGTLCVIASADKAGGDDLVWDSAPDFLSWQKQNDVFKDMAAVETGRSFTLTGKGGPQLVEGDRVTTAYFKIIGMAPLLGRTFLRRESQTGNNDVVILSYSLWIERYGADPNVIGKHADVNGAPCTIVGVMPQMTSSLFGGYDHPRLWKPLVFSAKDLTARDNHYINMVVARLRPGVTLTQAQAEMDSIAERLASEYPATNKHWGVTVLNLQEYLVREANVRESAIMLLVVVGFVLLIACANIAGLLLARGSARAHELAVRAAVGASRVRLVHQMLVESLLIGAAGGAAALALSVWGIPLLRTGLSINPYGSGQAQFIHLDTRTLLFTLGISVISAILFGVAPAVRTSKVSPQDALTEGTRTVSTSFARSHLRNSLVVGEVALAVALLAGAGVMMREVIREVSEPLGFNAHHLVIANLQLDSRQYQKPAARLALFKQVVQHLQNVPGVESASLDNCIILACGYSASFTVVARGSTPKPNSNSAAYFVVGPGYFQTMQIPLVKGRGFSNSDNSQSPAVAVVNQEFARRYFPKDGAIGQWIEAVTVDPRPAQIVGVVANVSEYPGQIRLIPQLYESELQFPFNAFPSTSLVVRSGIDTSSLAPLMRRAVWSVDKDQPVTIQTMQGIFANDMGGDKLMVALMGIFAGLALLLASVGTYGVISYTVTQRTREIGIRMALGAQKKDVLGLLLLQGGALAVIGSALGILFALPLPRVVSGLFSDFAPQGPSVAIGVAFFVVTVSLVATYIPARRAMRVDPVVALRYE